MRRNTARTHLHARIRPFRRPMLEALEDRTFPGDPIHLLPMALGALGLPSQAEARRVLPILAGTAGPRDPADSVASTSVQVAAEGRGPVESPDGGPVGNGPDTWDLIAGSLAMTVPDIDPASARTPAPRSGAGYGASNPGPAAQAFGLASGPMSASTTAPANAGGASVVSGWVGGLQGLLQGPAPASGSGSRSAAAPTPSRAPAVPTAPGPAATQAEGSAIAFEPNQGQADPSVLFLARGDGYEMALSADAMTFALARAMPGASGPSVPGLGAPASTPPAIDVLRMQFVGANPSARAVGVDQLPGTVNDLIGDDPSGWHTDIPTFSGVQLQGVYPGIDLDEYGDATNGQMEYDWDVAPGADPGAIRLAFQGTDGEQVSPQGDLILDTPGGALTEQAPTIYQVIGGVRQSVAGGYVTGPDGTIGLSVGAYDTSLPLTIDPVVTYSTYLGGSGADVAWGVAADSAGDTYVTGYTLSPDFATSGSYQTQPGGSFDAYVTELSPDGSTALYSTYLGGSGLDVGTGIAVDSIGDAYVTGYTESTNFPTTAGAFQPELVGERNAFVTELSPTGDQINESTYLGGSGQDQAAGIAVDSIGDAFVAGTTTSSDFPTVDPIQAGLSGTSDAFVTEVNPSGSGLVDSTYLGGSSGNGATGIALDTAGNVYVTGYTSSSDFPTVNPIQGTLGGSVNAFVSKLSASDSGGLTLAYSTYLGGSGTDVAEGIAVDASGRAYVTGYTTSADFPTANPIQGTFQGGPVNGTDAFVSRLSASGSSLEYSTYLGGTGDDYGRGIAVDSAGDAYVVGQTDSNDFPTASPIQAANAGGTDAFLTALNASGSDWAFSTYDGGSADDYGTAVALAADAPVMVGYSYSTDFPTTSGADQPTYGGGLTDAFVVAMPVAIADDDTLTTGPNETTSIDLNAITSSPDGTPLTFTILQQPTDGSLTDNASTGFYDYRPNPDFTGDDSFTYQANDGSLESDPATVNIIVQDPAPVADDESITVPPGQTTGIPLDDTWGDSDDPDTDTVVQQPADGTLAYDPETGLYDYTPAAGFTGVDSFTYQVNDGIQNGNIATVTINVSAPTGPVAADQQITIAPNQTASIVLLTQTTAADGDPLTTSIIDPPADGSLNYSDATGLYYYTPDQNFIGMDSFTYVENDGIADGNVATVDINVAYPAPVASDNDVGVDPGQTTAINLLADAFADSGNPLTATIVQPTADGTLTADGQAGQYDYTPDPGFTGRDSFTYTVSDGLLVSNVATITLYVADQGPVADDATITTAPDQTTSINLLADAQKDDVGDPLLLSIVQQPSDGTLVYDAATGLYRYTPLPGFDGTDSFTFQAQEDDQFSNIATVSIIVQAPAPVARDATVEAGEDLSTSIDLLADATAAIGSTLTASIVSQPARGTLSYDAGTELYVYTPNSGYVGPDSFTYKVNDGSQDSNVATISINVAAAPPAETATDTWTGAVDNNWFTPGNWNLGRIPAARDNVVINTANAQIQTAGGQAITVNSLALQAGTLTIAQGVSLTVTSGNRKAQGELQVGGTLVIDGALSFNSTVTLNGGNVTIQRQGTATWLGGSITSQNNASFTDYGTFTNQGGTTWNAQDAASSFTDGGLFVQDNPKTTALDLLVNVTGNGNAPFNINGVNDNPGIVWVKQGDVQIADKSALPFLAGGRSTSGTFLVEPKATLEFPAGNYELDATSSVQGGGTVLFSGGCWIDSGSYQVGTTEITDGYVMFGPNPKPAPQVNASTTELLLTGGNLTGWGTLTVQNHCTWTDGTVVSWDPNAPGAGRNIQFTLESQGVLDMQGVPGGFVANANVGYNATLVNNGVINWLGGSFDYVGLATIDNINTFNARGGGDLFGGMAGHFNNSGLFDVIPAKAQRITIYPPFSNTGQLLVNAGTFSILRGSARSAVITVAPGATLAFHTYSIDAQSTINAAGATIDFQGRGGLVSINCAYSTAITNLLGPTVSFNDDATTVSGTMSAGVLAGDGDFTVASKFTWTGGRMAGSGETMIPSGSQLTIDSAKPVSIGLDRTLVNEGETSWIGAGGGLMSGKGTISNDGDFSKTDASTAEVDPAFNNVGTLEVDGGTLLLGGGGLAAGEIDIDPAATLGFVGGSFTVDAEITTAGTVSIGGGTVTVDVALSAGALSVSRGTVNCRDSAITEGGVFSGGVIGGTGTLTIDGAYQWTGGSLRIATAIVAASSVLTIEDEGEGANPSLTMGAGAVLDNEGTIKTLEYSGIGLANGPATIDNAGALIVEGQLMNVAVALNNTGEVAVQSGLLYLSGGGQSTGGTFQVSDDGNLTFGGGPNVAYTVDQDSTFTIAPGSTQGVVFFSGGSTVIDCAIDLYQIVVDGGTAILNGYATVGQAVLSGGTLSGSGTLTVTTAFDWTGGMMTSSGVGAATTTIESGADLFLFEGSQSASNRTIDIEDGANGYLFEDARVSFRGSVTLNNAGSFSAFDYTSINATATDAFNNTGSFTSGGSDGTGTTFIGAPFNNSGQVAIVAGILSLQSGTSTGAWSISDGAALSLTGSGTGAAAQVYAFNAGSTFAYPAPAQPPPGPRQYGLILVNGGGDGGLRVQTNLSVNQVQLVAGDIGGYGNLIVTNQMVWSGGTMDNAGPANPSSPQTIGEVTIGSGGALFMIGTTLNGTLQTPVLARPLNIQGNVGWVESPGSVNVGINRTTPTPFTNTVQAINQSMLAEIPPASDWSKLAYGGYGDPVAMAQALKQVLTTGVTAQLSIASGWRPFITSLSAGDGVTAFFQRLPAIERASIDVAFARLYGSSINDFIRANVKSTRQQDRNANTLITGQPEVGGLAQFRQVSLLTGLQMAGGIVAGIGAGAVGQLVDLARLVYSLVTSPVATVNGIVVGLQDLLQQMNDGKFAEAASTLFPDIAAVYQSFTAGKLVSFDGGMAVGRAVSSVVVQAVGAYFTGGSLNLISATTRIIIQAAKALLSGAKVVVRQLVPVLAAASRLARPLALAARAGASLVRGVPGGQALAKVVATPLSTVAERAGNALRRFCFTPDTLVSTASGPRRLGDVGAGEYVHAFDFESGGWVLTRVLERHDSRYDGEIVAVHLGGACIEATANHPFWVVEGPDLILRGEPEHLDAGEDQGRSLAGRWVNSQDLRAGDLVWCLDGATRRVDLVERRIARGVAVCNLTIRDLHSFAVGPCGVLVHNTGWCDILENDAKIPRPQALIDFVNNSNGRFSPRQIHGHHIVQKTVPKGYSAISGSAFDSTWSVRQKATWFIGKSQDLLTSLDIPILTDPVVTRNLAREGKTLYNLTWAINGNGTHSLATIEAVYERLKRATNGQIGTAATMAAQNELKTIGAIFSMGGLITFP